MGQNRSNLQTGADGGGTVGGPGLWIVVGGGGKPAGGKRHVVSHVGQPGPSAGASVPELWRAFQGGKACYFNQVQQ